jgi:hypothetical protein
VHSVNADQQDVADFASVVIGVPPLAVFGAA